MRERPVRFVVAIDDAAFFCTLMLVFCLAQERDLIRSELGSEMDQLRKDKRVVEIRLQELETMLSARDKVRLVFCCFLLSNLRKPNNF